MNYLNLWTCFVDKFDPFAAEPTFSSKSPVNVSYIGFYFFIDFIFCRLSFFSTILHVKDDLLKIVRAVLCEFYSI